MITLLFVASLSVASPQSPQDSKAPDANLQRILSAAAHPTMHWGDLSDVRKILSATYTANGWQPLWITSGGLTAGGKRTLAALMRAADLGLVAADYDSARLGHDETRVSQLSPADQATFDLTLSAAATRYTIALHKGRVDPRQWHPYLRLTQDSLNLPGILASLAATADPDSLWRSVQPQHPEYWRLVALLKTMREQSPQSVFVPLKAFPEKLIPGMAFTAADHLRALLTALGEMNAAPAVAADTLYDTTLVTAMMGFQKHHGLNPDGVVGPVTRMYLLRPWSERIQDVARTLERWRWLPTPTSGRVVLVNIPAMRVRAEDPGTGSSGRSLEMDVVIGKIRGFQTPLLSTFVNAVQVRPSWIVPNSIARDEIRGKALADPAMIAKDRYQLIHGDSVLPATPENIRRMGSGVEVRQLPGPRNALAQMKLSMANPANIYLHDSPERGLFKEPLRAFSHGCVRLSDAMALARFLLTGNSRSSEAEWTKVLAGEASAQLFLSEPVPVMIVYHTVTVSEAGTPTFYQDIYAVDATLDAALKKGPK